MIMPFSVALTVPLVVPTLLLKCVLESFTCLMVIEYFIMVLLLTATTEPGDLSISSYIVDQLVLLLDSFDVLFLKLVGHLMLIYT
jgi:hypothetical protein